MSDECRECHGLRLIEDPTACGDEDHCTQFMTCWDCDGEGTRVAQIRIALANALGWRESK